LTVSAIFTQQSASVWNGKFWRKSEVAALPGMSDSHL